MKKRMAFSMVISVMVVLALLLGGCEELRSTPTPAPTPAPTPTPTPPPTPTPTPTPSPNLTPARDLTGTWVSSLPGRGAVYQGVVLVGAYLGPGTNYVDVELTLKQEGNKLTGFVRFYNLRMEADPEKVRQAEESRRRLEELVKESGAERFQPPPAKEVSPHPELTGKIINGKVWGTRFQFEAGGITWSGGFLTDMMEGTIKRPAHYPYPGVSAVDGEFDLMRESSDIGPIVIPTKPASLVCSDADYYSLCDTLKNWGFDFVTSYERVSREALINNWTSFWIGSSEDETKRVYFDRVGDNWKPRPLPAPPPTPTPTPEPTPKLTTLAYTGRFDIKASTVSFVHMGFGDSMLVSEAATVPFEITLKEAYEGGPLTGEVEVKIIWHGSWKARESFPEEKSLSGVTTGEDTVRVSGRFDPAEPEHVHIDLHEGDFDQDAVTLGITTVQVELGSNLRTFIPDYSSLGLFAAVFDAEERGLGKFKVTGDSVTLSASGNQLGVMGRLYLFGDGEWTITATLTPVSPTPTPTPTPTPEPTPDTTPPDPPMSLTSTAYSSTQIDLSWFGSEDNVGVAGYKIFRDGEYIQSVTTTSFSDTGLAPNTFYCYTIIAYDAAGNESVPSEEVCVTTRATSVEKGGAEGKETLIIAGGPSPTDGISIDDDLTLFLNGVGIFVDSDGHDNSQFGGFGTLPPIEVSAKNGDLLRLVAVDTQGGCRDLSPLYLHRVSDGAVQFLDGGFTRECGTQAGEIFYDKTFTIALPTLLTPTPEPTPTPELVTLWHMDEGTGDMIHDATTNHNDGAINGATWTDGRFGYALRFDGVDDWVMVKQPFIFHQSTDATLSFWIKPDDTVHRSIFWTRATDSDLDRFNIFSGRYNRPCVGFDYRSPNGTLHSLIEIEIPENQWVHIAVTRSGNTYSFYKDGQFVGQATDTNPDLPSYSLVDPWFIGRRGGYMYKGLIDEVAMYSFALSADEIYQIYQEPSSP